MKQEFDVIRRLEPAIDGLVADWGFVRSSPIEFLKKKSDLTAWLANFQSNEIEDALLLASQLTVISDAHLRRVIHRLASEIRLLFDGNLDGILFFPLGDSPSDSGGNFLYDFRKELGISGDHFPAGHFRDFLSSARAVVFVDDIIGSGNQATKYYNSNLVGFSNCYYISMLAFADGLKNVRNRAAFRDVLSGEILSVRQRAFSSVSSAFPDARVRRRLKNLAQRYGERLYPKGPLGYDNSQAMIVFPHNTPNNTLPIFWCSPSNEKLVGQLWSPLWDRRKASRQMLQRRLRFSPETTAIDRIGSHGPETNLQFLGQWTGIWRGSIPGELDHTLVVFRIRGNRAELVYFSGDCPVWNVQAGHRRAFGTIRRDKIILEWPETTINYHLQGNGSIRATRDDSLGHFECHMILTRK